MSSIKPAMAPYKKAHDAVDDDNKNVTIECNFYHKKIKITPCGFILHYSSGFTALRPYLPVYCETATLCMLVKAVIKKYNIKFLLFLGLLHSMGVNYSYNAITFVSFL